ncbi:MAG: VOC family protein [Terriglobia bacterium]|nr:MAG: VOC family protein [Terriglobia bacterium]
MGRCLPIALLAWLPAMTADLKVDHATAAGRDLRAMERAIQAAGMPYEYGGPHANHATEMALISFPDGSYLELIAIQPQAEPAAVAATPWQKCMEGNAGPCAWAVRPMDLSAEAARLKAAAVPVTPPARNGRKRPDGVQLDWETAQVGAGNGNFFPFLIRDFTPRDRRAYPGGKPTTANFTGIAKVVLAVRDLDGAIARYERAYALPAPQKQDDSTFGAKLAWFPGTPVVLAAPASPQSWLTERLDRYGEMPCAFILGGGKVMRAAANWFGTPISWLASDTLGWRLGVEP